MWQCVLDSIDLITKIAQTLIAGFVAWLAWRTFIKEETQEAEDYADNSTIDQGVTELKIFETTNQTTTLKRTINGIECHLDDRRPNKKQGHRWTLTPNMVKEILESGDIYVNPSYKLKTGYLSIGTHTNWLYSKNLFPEPAGLHHRVIELLKSVGA
ncbi:hypothetical protein [Microbulbifer sp. YPW1]|uniref:hypothetical protein n=1 Tax=Microbulbifer sp. YPW1 TaxID=2745199 RepID=UPI001597AFC1|nr:hypothetical protein [Microbulbifer sp. YPW1]QKX17753.1 hypothetical protein HUW35_12645 [Microbulbifer sp. YPW1]